MTEATDRYRKASQALRAGTLRDFLKLWPALDPRRMDETFPGWAFAVQTLIERDRATMAGLSSEYLRAMRFQAGVPGEPLILLPERLPREQVEAALSATARAGFFVALGSGRSPAEASKVALVRASGAATRLVASAGRDTVRRSLVADPQGTGWRRVTSAGACGFCRMLAGRGEVYSAETADFASHDWCGCAAEPVYGGDLQAVRTYAPSQRRRSDETRARDNARAREFIAN